MDRNVILYSSLGTDPDLSKLVDAYVDEMPARIAALTEAFTAGDMETLGRKAHQLKGAAGSYGFDQLTPYAAALEASIRTNRSIDAIRQALGAVVDMCHRVQAGSPAQAGNFRHF